MNRAIILVALGAMLLSTGLHAADYCDDKIEPGESPDGKGMMMYNLMVQLAFAERYCGAPATPPSRIAVVVEEFHGCGPRARLEADIEKRMKDDTAAKITTTDGLIRDVVAGDDEDMSQIEVDRRAKAGIETEMGGCSELLKTQGDVEERYRNPPKWPPEPEK
ncbi:hypothetical protein EOA30_11475 [Mesorhizobium sp. M8A.F.Ca.ET.059.01.1.1]|nr:hypothetical protein EOA30_11475 [Mesorhizobium sp. M8A.F.Ca.ET.059.01.1.1]